MTNLESTKLGNKHVVAPSMPASEELVLEIFAIVSVYDSFLFAWTWSLREECRLSLNTWEVVIDNAQISIPTNLEYLKARFSLAFLEKICAYEDQYLRYGYSGEACTYSTKDCPTFAS